MNGVFDMIKTCAHEIKCNGHPEHNGNMKKKHKSFANDNHSNLCRYFLLWPSQTFRYWSLSLFKYFQCFFPLSKRWSKSLPKKIEFE